MTKLFSAVFLLFCCNVVWSVTLYTEDNRLCITEWAKNGESFYWCYTDTDYGWRYCLQNANLQQQVIHEVQDKGNRILTEWILVENDGIRENVNYKYRTAARTLISRWNLNGIALNANAGTLFNNDDARIDLQGLFNQNNMRFANIQIQMNVPRVPGESTTIAIIRLQAGKHFPIGYIRKALLESLVQKGLVILQQRTLP